MTQVDKPWERGVRCPVCKNVIYVVGDADWVGTVPCGTCVAKAQAVIRALMPLRPAPNESPGGDG